MKKTIANKETKRFIANLLTYKPQGDVCVLKTMTRTITNKETKRLLYNSIDKMTP